MKYNFSSGDWIKVEDEFAIVECVVPMYLEPYDVHKEDKVSIGEYKYTAIAYHTFCTLQGKVCSSKAQVKYLDFCNWIKPVTQVELSMIEEIKSKKAKAFGTWKSKWKDANEYFTIYVQTEKGKASDALSKFRKACKALSDRFTFSDLYIIMDAIPEIKAETASTGDVGGDYISFEVCYTLKEQKGNQLSFYKIREFDCAEDLSSFLNFEGVFISLYKLLSLYNQKHHSPKLDSVLPLLKEEFHGLFDQDFTSHPFARDFFKKAPKVNYTYDLAYSTLQSFITRNAKELDIEEFARLFCDHDDEIERLYQEVLGMKS